MEVEEVEGKEDAVDEELVGGEEVGLGQGRVEDLPELELGRVGRVGACSPPAG